jgi:hypothetical protein
MSKAKTAAAMSAFDPSAGRKSRKLPIKQVARMIKQRLGSDFIQENQKTENPQNVLKFGWVDQDLCWINYERQRWPEPPAIKKLIKLWNLGVVTPLSARYDPNENRYYIADGQQHGIAYILQYPDSPLPVFYVESTDPKLETDQLLALNIGNMPMALYFIHEQMIKAGDPFHIELETRVQNAGCSTGYKKRAPGVITHMVDLQNAAKDFGFDNLELILTKYRTYWPMEVVKTATMLGFLKVVDLMQKADVFDEIVLDDVFAECAEYFESADRLHLDIKDEFAVKYPGGYKGMNVREKVASGIINVYEKSTGNKLVDAPFDIDMPMMKAAA